jgi:alpha-galactosidase
MEATMSAITESRWNTLTGQVPIALGLEGQFVEPVGFEANADGIAYRYPFGLVAIGHKVVRQDTVEWTWRLENQGALPSPRVTAFHPLVLSFACQGRLAPVLHGSRGGLDDANYPPESWRQWSCSAVTEGLAQKFRASSAGGRSANRDLPFFVVQDTDRQGGLFVGLGWSGDWHLQMSRQAEQVLLQAGMTNLALSLRPGESFGQPSVLLGRFRGSAADGQRALRAVLRDQVQPSLGGVPMRPVSFWDSYYGDRGQFYEKDALEEIPLAAAAGLEYFVVDGGWSGGGHDGQFSSLLPHIGSWRAAKDKFPNGFAPLKDLAGKQAIRLGLWFDIERAHRDSMAAQQVPELFFADWEGGGCRLLKLHKDEARDWALETISAPLRALDAGWLRYDMNCDPAGCWAQHDAADRRGETEIRYIENLYRLLDALRSRFPETIIENCASGGRRIDLETLRRSHTDWISDHTQAESIIRYNLHGASRWLPANHLNTSMAHSYLEPNRPVNWNEPLPACAYLSHFGGNFSVSDRLKPLTAAARDTLRRAVDLFRSTAPCFAGEVHALGEQENVLEGPAGLAALDPATGRRAVVLFGVAPSAAATLVPEEFRALVSGAPAFGDSGTGQFISAYLWHG